MSMYSTFAKSAAKPTMSVKRYAEFFTPDQKGYGIITGVERVKDENKGVTLFIHSVIDSAEPTKNPGTAQTPGTEVKTMYKLSISFKQDQFTQDILKLGCVTEKLSEEDFDAMFASVFGDIDGSGPQKNKSSLRGTRFAFKSIQAVNKKENNAPVRDSKGNLVANTFYEGLDERKGNSEAEVLARVAQLEAQGL